MHMERTKIVYRMAQNPGRKCSSIMFTFLIVRISAYKSQSTSVGGVRIES